MSIIDTKDRERFERKIIKQDNGCWIWMAHKNSQGYGSFRYKDKIVKAHRFAWMIEYGDIPHDTCVCHHCDNPSCCNAKEHMFLGTNNDNVQDKINKGRGKRTEEWSRKIGLAHKGNKYCLGRKLSEEHKLKISLAQKGNKNRLGIKHTEEACKKIGIGHKGRKASEETKKKMSLTRKGLRPTEEARKNMSLAQMGNKHNLGKKASKENCEKRSMFMKEYWKNKKIKRGIK